MNAAVDGMRSALQARRARVDDPSQRSLMVKARFGIARALHIASRLSGRPIKVKTETFWNDRMELIFPEVVSECIFRTGYYEPGLTTMLIERLRPGDVFLDVGAHFGYFSLLASALVGPTGQVHAFEPTPSTYDVLGANVRRNRNVTTVNEAVFDKPTTLQLNDYGVQFSAYNSLFGLRLSEGERHKVKGIARSVVANTIDAYLAARELKASFIKIDAEEAELEVLRGAEQTLARGEVAISVEVGDDERSGGKRRSRDVVDHLMARGYEPLEFKADHLAPHEPRQRYEYDNLLFVPARSGANFRQGYGVGS